MNLRWNIAMTSRLRALLLSACLLVPMGYGSSVDAAPSTTRSSSGYTRSAPSAPSASAPTSSFTPRSNAFSAPPSAIETPAAPRAPMSAGGYTRSPQTSSQDRAASPATAATAAPMGLGASASDRSYSEQQQSANMARLRAARDAPPAVAAAAPTRSPWGTGTPSSAYYSRAVPPPNPTQNTFYVEHHYYPPSYAYHDYGMMNGVFTYYMLSHLGDNGGSSYFYNHYDDPGYRAWRADADRQAQDNAQLRQQLADLDARLAQQQGQPRDPNYVPPGVPSVVAAANPVQMDAATAQHPAKKHGHGLLWLVLGLIVLGVIGVIVYLKFFKPQGTSSAVQSGTLGSVNLAASMVKARAKGETYSASRYRLGMMVTVDPTPFLLAGDALHTATPDSGAMSVTGIGRPADGSGKWVRLHLPGGKDMVIVQTGPQDEPLEARLFHLLGTEPNGTEEEFQFWEAKGEGAIGWKDFTSKDGAVWGRVWEPGSDYVEPRTFTEEIEEVGGKRTVTSFSELYSRATGAPALAPQFEFLLLASIKERGVVEIWSGVDINTASLGIA
jgi:hypothetical protein